MCLSCVIEEVTGLDLSTDEGHDALVELGRVPWPAATAGMVECAAYIAALYANPAGGTGGPLHVVTDDNNVNESSLDFCRSDISGWVCYDCEPIDSERVKALSVWILDLMAPMSNAERQVSIGLAHGDLSEIQGAIYMPATEFPIREPIVDAEGNEIGMRWGFRSRRVDANVGESD